MVRDPDYWIYIKQLYLAVDDLARGKMERDYGWWILREQVMQTGRNPFQMAEDGFRSISFTKVYQDNLLGRAMHSLSEVMFQLHKMAKIMKYDLLQNRSARFEDNTPLHESW